MLSNTDIFIGYDCTLFQMMLLADGIYMPMAVKRFTLVKERNYLVNLPSVVEAFCFVKRELNKGE